MEERFVGTFYGVLLGLNMIFRSDAVVVYDNPSEDAQERRHMVIMGYCTSYLVTSHFYHKYHR